MHVESPTLVLKRALSTRRIGEILISKVGRVGDDPTTCGLVIRRSIQLSYRPGE